MRAGAELISAPMNPPAFQLAVESLEQAYVHAAAAGKKVKVIGDHRNVRGKKHSVQTNQFLKGKGGSYFLIREGIPIGVQLLCLFVSLSRVDPLCPF